MATVTTAPPGVSPDLPLFRISLDVYHSMGKLGLLTPADRVMLLDGLLVTKTPKSPRHATATQKTQKSLESILPNDWHIRKEEPISLAGGPEGADSEPEPDLAVVRGDDATYAARHPSSADVALVVEVADTSLAQDREGLRRYGWAGIPSVWVVNLSAGVVEVYTEPSGPTVNPGYARRLDHGADAALTVLLDGTPHGPVAVAHMLP